MFHNARIKLTAWYLIIIMIISVSFSVVIYNELTREMDRFVQTQRFRIERRLNNGEFFPQDTHIAGTQPQVPIFDPELVDETKHRLLIVLFLVNGGIFVIAGGLGYFLAGRTLRPIQDMLDEQKRFIGDSSHELRTPLTSLKSTLEVNLRNKKLTLKDAQTLIADSILEVNKLQTLSDELLTLAQYEKSNNSTKNETLDLADILSSALKKISPIAKKKTITIENKTENITIHGIKHALTDLFVILLDNAVKYSDTESSIEVTTKQLDNSIQVLVIDHGHGIEDKDLPYIFDRFYRVDSARTKTDISGYGLGLAIAKQIAETHNGSITVKSVIKKGSIFTVTLPTSRKT